MAKVICTLPNASTLINGVKFEEHKLGVISEEIEEDVAKAFTAIKGYRLALPAKEATGGKDATGGKEPPLSPPPPPPTEDGAK